VTDKTLDSNENNIKFIKGDYEVFEVGNELVFSDNRNKIKEYAQKMGVEHLVYKISFHSREEAESIAKEV